MAGGRRKVANAVRAQSLPQGIEQRGAASSALGLLGCGGGGEGALARLNFLGDGDGEAHGLEPEAGLDEARQALELEAAQAGDVIGALRRQCEGDVEPVCDAINAIKSE